MLADLPPNGKNGECETDVNDIKQYYPEAPANGAEQPTDRAKLNPEPSLLAPSRQVNLPPVDLSGVSEATPVELLLVRELKGPGATFTPFLSEAVAFRGLVYQPHGEYETQYQLLAESLLSHPRILPRLKVITFVPAFAWPTLEVVIVPIKRTRHGILVWQSLNKLADRLPDLKVYIEWDLAKRRHLVQQLALSAEERELLARIERPTRDQVIEALQMHAFGSLEDLVAANDEIRTVLQAREVK